MVLLLFQCTFLPISMLKLIICHGDTCFQSCIFFLTLPKLHFNLGVYQRWICWHPHIPLNVSSNTPWKIHYLWGIGVECIQPSLDVSGKLCLSSSCISSSSYVQVSGRTCHRSFQTFDSSGTMLDGGSLAFHSSQHVGRCSLALSCHKSSHHGCLSMPGAQGSAISAFKPLAAQRYVWCRQGFSSSICQAVVGTTQVSTVKVYEQWWKEWTGLCA